jgi:hypothetical protein
MLLLLTGEGPSDIGGMINDRDGMQRFDPGPLAVVIDQITEQVLGFSPLTSDCIRHVARGPLAAMAKAMKPRPSFILPGAKRPGGNAADYRQAFAIAVLAKQIEEEERDKVVAVIFRDSDGTRTDSLKKWDELVNAIESAFIVADHERGVAMIAKPKQEAWFLCAMKADPYQNCMALEKESGNDNSPVSLKNKVAEILGRAGDKAALLDWLNRDGFDHDRIDMPSFNHFRETFKVALTKISKARS